MTGRARVNRVAVLTETVAEGLNGDPKTWPAGTRVQIIHSEPHYGLRDNELHLVEADDGARFWVNDWNLEATR